MAQQLNYNHLRYFHAIASEGSVLKAAESLHLSPQTVSGQLAVFEDYLGVKLFDRIGKRLVVNEAGKLVQSYANEIFALGTELQQNLNSADTRLTFVFNVGVTDIIPKMLAANILKSCYKIDGPIKLVCREGEFDSLLSDLAMNKLDIVLSDRPLPPGIAIKAFNHLLGETGLSFYAKPELARSINGPFPACLHQQNFLISGEQSNQKINLQSWFNNHQIYPNIRAEFDDSAMLKYFGQLGFGVFSTPSIIEEQMLKHYDVEVVGRTKEVKEQLYAISPERRVTNLGVKLLIEAAENIYSKSLSDND